MAYIFLSYAKSDRDSAFVMREVLRNEGLTVWMDENFHELSRWNWAKVQANILNAGAFVILVSDVAKKSAWVQRELDYAEKIQKPIVPILIQGETWSRLSEAIPTQVQGLRLDIPDEAAKQLKKLLKTSSDRSIPLQFPLDKAIASLKTFILGFCLIAIAIILISRFIPFATAFIQTLAASPVPQTTREVMQATSAASIASRQTQNADNRAVREESRRTRTQVYLDVEATSSVLSVTRDAAATQNSIRHTQEAILTVTQEYQLNQTAIVGGGTLPCNATVVMENEISSVTLYPGPSLSLGSATLSRTGGELQQFVLTEWIVNEAGSWYRVGTSSRSSMGYALAEELALDETCPR
jgi:hypothetical protein